MLPAAGERPAPGYTLSHQLGAGAFGDVWEAVGPEGRRFALKFLDCRKRSSSMVAAEVRLLRGLASLNHPHIITLHGVHTWGQYVVLIMERADSNLEDLRQSYRTKTGGNVPPAHALELLGQAAQALDFIAAHKNSRMTGSQGMQHCDVKPTNLLLIGNTLKLADFGLCAGTGWQTHTGGWRGTPPYAAPELFRGSPAPGTDQFALAVTFCDLVIGERAMTPHTPADTPPVGTPVDMTKLREQEYPVLARAMHPYPSSRYPSCQAFIDDLRRVVERQRPATRVYPRGLSGTLRRAAALKGLGKK
jgi:serine/threonine protein kinase